MPLKTIYRRSPEVVMSFDYKDVLNGQGYLTYYLATALDSTATKQRVLTPNIVDSNDVSTTDTSDAVWADFTLILDHDYDLTIQKGGNIAIGTATAQITVNSNSNYSAHYSYWVVRLRKDDGSSETEIASGKTPTLQDASAGDVRHLLKMGISSGVSLNKGDILRVTVELWEKQATSGHSQTFIYYHDPAARTADHDTIISIPFKLPS